MAPTPRWNTGGCRTSMRRSSPASLAWSSGPRDELDFHDRRSTERLFPGGPMRSPWPILVSLILLGSTLARAQDEHSHEAGDLGRVGSAHFPVTCAPELQADFDRAVAILHSFFYEESE